MPCVSDSCSKVSRWAVGIVKSTVAVAAALNRLEFLPNLESDFNMKFHNGCRSCELQVVCLSVTLTKSKVMTRMQT